MSAKPSPDITNEPDVEITLAVLNAIHGNARITQRSVAQELDVALGLVNAYLKRCVAKGFVKIRQIPPRRYAYYLTPTGFNEKRRLTAEYLRQSFRFLRVARDEFDVFFATCRSRGWERVMLYGLSELSDIALLSAREIGVPLVGVIDPNSERSDYHGLPVRKSLSGGADACDAIVITDTNDAQAAFDLLTGVFAAERVMAPRVFGVVPHPLTMVD